MKYLYSLLFYLCIPIIMLYLKKRGRKNPAYNLLWNERFGLKLVNPSLKPIIWLHAVSVGETRAMAKLIQLLAMNYPQYQILITQMTPTGRYMAQVMFPQAMLHYLPYDLPHAMRNFYNTFKPQLCLIMETEIWPNLINEAHKFGVPIYLINARLSHKSYTKYAYFRKYMNPILNNFNGIICQDRSSAQYFYRLGYMGHLPILGNTKFDIVDEPNRVNVAQFLQHNIPNKRIIVFASTRAGEEKLILEAVPKDYPHLIILVPRHPERFAIVESLLHDFKYQKRSAGEPIADDTQILLGDSLGEMFIYYTMADIAVIGGSFVNLGGQNLIEAINFNCPVIFGPSMFNFTHIAHNAINAKCAIQVADIYQCFDTINNILSNAPMLQLLIHQCEVFIKQYQGASWAVVQLVRQDLVGNGI